MKVLFQGLYSKFNADTNFKNAVGSQFYPGVADQENATFPYAVYTMVSNDSDWTFSEDIELFAMQISVFDNSTSPGTILDAETHLYALFDDAILTVSGYSFVRMQRRNTQLIRDEPQGAWHLAVDYEIEIQK